MASVLRSGLSRRSFLYGTTGLVAGLAAGGAGGYLLGRDRREECGACTPDETAWRQLNQLLPNKVLRPGEAGYAEAAQPNNLRYACVLPQGIARCATPDDVANAIRWSRDYDLPIVVRAGGHSYAGYSTTYGLMLDVRPMNDIAVDEGSGRVTVAGGAVNKQVYAALREKNLAITHGRCPSVGAAAFLLGGGIGFNMRRKGLACDQLLETELVTAAGERRTANAATDPALFWASRGAGGGNLGVSTSFTLQTFPADPLTVFKIKWSSKPEAVADALMAALDAAPITLGSRFSLGAVTPQDLASGKDVTVDLIGQMAGSTDDVAGILAPAYAAALPSSEDIQETSYWKGQEMLEEEGHPTYYQERSAFVVAPFGAEGLAEGFRWLRSWPGTGGYCDLRFFQTGGAINDVSPTATAFVHRDSDWLMVVGLYWDAKDNSSPDVMHKAHDWQNGFYQAMLPFTGGGAYQNFPDPSLADWRRAYYGANLDMLARIKAAVDPTNVFQFPQAV